MLYLYYALDNKTFKQHAQNNITAIIGNTIDNIGNSSSINGLLDGNGEGPNV